MVNLCYPLRGLQKVSVSLRDGDARRLISSQVTSVMSARSYHRRQRVDVVMKDEDIGQSEWEEALQTDAVRTYFFGE